MNNNKGRSVAGLVVVFLAVLGCALPAGSVEPTSKPTTKPSGLGQYYGFGQMEMLKLRWGIGLPRIVDLNGDGLNDIVITNNQKARIELLLQKKDFDPTKVVPPKPEEDDINDIFGKEASWRFKRVSYDLDVAATALVVTDLNGDGWADLAYYSKEGLYVALQQPVKGKKKVAKKKAPAGKDSKASPREPAWLPAKKIEVRGGLTSESALASGDLNGDKRTDLAVLTGDGVFIVLQKKDGSLGHPLKYHSGGRSLRRLDIADVNGDGRFDLVVLTARSDFPVSVRFQTDAGKLGPEVRYRLPNPSVFGLARLGKSTRSHFVTVSSHSGRVLISTLAPDPRQASFPVYTHPLPATDQAGNRDIVAADVNGDGLKDVVVSDPSRAEFLLLTANKKTSLGAPKRFPGLMDMRKLCAGDLDGKGRDAVVALSIKEKLIAVSRLQKGRLTFPVSVRLSGDPMAMDIADIDGDKKLDLLYIGKEKKSGKYFLRTVLKVGRKDAKAGPELELTKLKDKPLDLRAADIDGDGRTDVMVLRPYGPILLVRRDKSGKFVEVLKRDIHSGLVANVYPESLSFAALGKKGATAALVSQKNFARALVFDPDKGWRVLDQYQAPSRQSTLAAAIAARLKPKAEMSVIAYDSARGKLLILSRQPDGTYRTTEEVKVGSISIKKMLAGNFGGQAKVSLLLAGTHKLVLVPAVARTELLRKVASFEPDIKDGHFGSLTVGDVNSDGCPDILLCEQGRHHVEILTFNAAGKIVTATKFKVFEAPREVERSSYGRRQSTGQPRAITLGDVTGDGKTDLVMLVHDRIIIYPQD